LYPIVIESEYKSRPQDMPWEPVPIAQRFSGSLRLSKVIRHEKCQFSPMFLRACPSNQEGKKKYLVTIA